MVPTGRRDGLSWARACVAAWMVLAALVSAPSPAWAQTGTLTGRLTNAATGAPVAGALVHPCTPLGCATASTNASGIYSVALVPGTYVMYTRGGNGLVDEIVDNVPCPITCDQSRAAALGAPVVVTAGATITRDIALSPGGTATGVVRDAATGAPLVGVRVVINTQFQGVIDSREAFTDAAGVFTFAGLGTGSFALFAEENKPARHIQEILGGIPCLGACDQRLAIDAGRRVAVTAGAVTSGIAFLLEPGGSISGTVRRTDTNAAQANVQVTVFTRIGSEPVWIASTLTNASGAYTVTGLPAGDYTVTTEALTLLNEVYDGVPCGARCELSHAAAGRLVPVPARGAVSGIDFGLAPGGTISGRLTDAGSGSGLGGQVIVYRVVGATAQFIRSGSSSQAGTYTLAGLPAGSYVVAALASGHVSQVSGGFAVINPTDADLLGGARVTVTDGVTTPNVNFALGAAASIRGRVRLSPSLTAVSGERVLLFANVGGGTALQVRTTSTNSAGDYTFDQIPTGLYQVATAAPQLDNQVYNGLTCPAGTCTPAFVGSNGALVPATAGLVTSNINLTLVAATSAPGAPLKFNVENVPGGARFTWELPFSGGPPTSYVVEAGLAPGTTFVSLPTTAQSMVIPGIPPGTFFLRVRGVNREGAGAPSNEIVLRVGAGGVVAPNPPEFLFPQVIDGKLTLTWDRPTSGPVPTSYQLEVGTAAGRSDIAVVPTPTRLFQFTGVPPGFYFVRVRAVVSGVVGSPSNDVTMVVGNVPAPPSEPTILPITVAGNVVTLRWEAPYFGPVTDYILEAGSQPGSSNIAVLRLGSTATSMTIPGVPPGRYYLRLRAVNALGVSAQSRERELVVP